MIISVQAGQVPAVGDGDAGHQSYCGEMAE